MAFISGYVTLPVDSYSAFRNSVLGNGYDADGYYGDQCWDLTAELWNNVGFPEGYPLTGPNEYASECWTVSKDQNTSYNNTVYFDLIENLSDVKRGDVVVLRGDAAFPTGHIGLADEDYRFGTGMLKILGQNQGTGGEPTPISNPDGGTTANVKELSVGEFLGAFRLKAWEEAPVTKPKHHFKWVLYARKLNQRRSVL